VYFVSTNRSVGADTCRVARKKMERKERRKLRAEVD
jgi:hypothetical protein